MNVLLVDDEIGVTKLFERILTDHTTHSFNDPFEALEFGRRNTFDIVVTDQKMPRVSGIDFVSQLRSIRSDLDFIALVVSAFTEAEDLIDAVNTRLITSYLVKPVHPNDLRKAVFQAQELLQVKRERDALQQELHRQNEELKRENRKLRGSSASLEEFVTVHPETVRLKEKVKMFAASDSPVLIYGETGTGKELIARGLHDLSPQRSGPFIALNCSAFSPHLLESELFGHEKGAYTGADGVKRGLLETAQGGSLFLDEIGDFPYEFQAKILRFIQFGTFIPVGGTGEKRAEIRIISATNKDLSERVQEGKFRQDLLYRLNTLTLSIPPLRRRVVDIIPIMEEVAVNKSFHLPPISGEVRRAIQAHPFWGNVRELEAFVEKLLLLDRQQPLEAVRLDHVQELLVEEAYTYRELGGEWDKGVSGKDGELVPFGGAELDKERGLKKMVEDFERKIIIRSLEERGYNISRSADALKMSRQGLKNKMERYGINVGAGMA